MVSVMIYFYNKKINGLFYTASIEDEEKLKEYVDSIDKQGYVLVSKDEYDVIEKQLLEEIQKETDRLNNAFISERKEAIADAKKAGWSDTMIDVAFGKAE